MAKFKLADVERYRSRLPEMAKEYNRRVMEVFAAWAREDLEKQHLTGRNIYGQRFPQPKRGALPMLETGNLMSNYEVSVNGNRLVVENAADYSAPLQADGVHVHLPIDGEIPPRWAAQLEKIKKTQARWLAEQLRH